MANSNDVIPYVVRAGDHVQEIAYRFGVAVADIQNEAQNAAVAQARGDMATLAPGDVLFIPKPTPTWLPVTVGGVNRFVGWVPSVTVHLKLVDGKKAIANAPYSVEGAGAAIQGTTDGQGHVEVTVPVTARIVHVTLTQTGQVFEVRVGGLDPIEEASGVQMRLAHLGLYGGPVDGQLTDHTRASVAAFQAQRGLTPTGDLDDDTRAALKDAHGS